MTSYGVDLEQFRRPKIVKTSSLKIPNYYTQALDGEFSKFAFNEERAPTFRGQWRQSVFNIAPDAPIDLEIGTGNGVHFQTQCLAQPDRSWVGIELKYKPLIQTIRGALKKGATNARVMRIHAFNVDEVFAPLELNNIYVHFPDPWTTPRKPKNRLMNPRMLDIFFTLQRPNSFLEFKTDSREMFLWAMENIRESSYEIEYETLDLANSPYQTGNIITGFEKIFRRQGIPINLVRMRKGR